MGRTYPEDVAIHTKRGRKKYLCLSGKADVMFNSTLVYELCVLKKYALEELDKIKRIVQYI